MGLAKVASCWCWLLLLILLCSLQAQKTGNREGPETPGGFVQEFYAWYVPRTLSDNPVPAYEFTLKHRSSAFTPGLFRALKEDFDAQAKVSDEIVGLDFDPFLNTQDPCERYEMGKITRKENAYWVEVYGVCSGKRSEKPDVVPEVVRISGHWLFANFHYERQAKQYPDSEDLLGILKLLREDRQTPRK
jgi:hypothetical protein